MIFFDLIKKHLDEIIYGGILGGILTTFIIYFFKKIKYGILFLFSDVFKTKRQRLESIHIEGATVVNRQFLRKIKRIGLKQKYKAEDFYLAKQYENCQWYGILNNWDIERDAYKTIKEELKNSFADEFRQPKIIALILGRGGSGKSTLMRRVAVDSVQNDFCTLWLNDKEISIFYKSGINYIANYSKTKFLILIEDWYRIKQNTAHAKEIIDSLCNYSNVRIIIGDRTLDNSISKEHIFNPDENIIELKVNENKKTITEIIKKVTHWKETAESLLTRENDYNSTLYLILWVIARSYQDKNGIIEKNTIRKEGLSGHFQTIVESDLRNIEKHYPGFAKALYYYGSIYSQNRIYFGLDTFLNIADEFSEKAIDNRLAFTSKEIKPILNIYINITKGLFKSAGNLSLVAFNHDILTDEGLFKSQVAGWHRFDESILLRILPIIINNGDSFSASTYFYTTLNKISFEDFPNEDRLKHLNALIFDKKNRGYYLNSLINGTIIISENDKVSYITTILNDFLYFDFSTRAICNCLNHIKNHPAAQRAATAILSQPDFYKLPKEIVSTAMKICKDEAEQQKAATAILSQPDFYKLPLEIVSTAMNICKDEAEQQKATKAILSQPDFFKLPYQIVSTAMKICKDEAEQQKAATAILSQPDLFKLPHQIVSTAMKICKDISKAEYFLSKWEKTNWGIVYQSLFCFTGSTNYPQFIHDIVNTIITSKSEGGGSYFRYTQLLKIPFQGIDIWDKECYNLIHNYSHASNASLINCVLFSHRSHPEKIRNICETILTNWKTEIVKPINQIYGTPHHGDNIKIAMGHPNLKILAKKTAEEILISESESPGTINEYLLENAHKIVSAEKYPEWINNNNEDIIE